MSVCLCANVVNTLCTIRQTQVDLLCKDTEMLYTISRACQNIFTLFNRTDRPFFIKFNRGFTVDFVSYI